MDGNLITCRVAQLIHNVKPEDNVFPWYVFAFDISTSFINFSDRQVFLVERRLILDDKTSRSTLVDLLLEMNVPLPVLDDDDVLIARILDCARRMASSECLKRRKVLRLRVEIDVRLSLDDDEMEDRTVLNVTPASESSIEALEKVRVDGCSDDCVICLEQILIGTEATRLPCSHVYHGTCIQAWLKSNGICPLCRSPINS